MVTYLNTLLQKLILSLLENKDISTIKQPLQIKKRFFLQILSLTMLNQVYRLNNMSTLKMLSFTVRVTLPSYLETMFFMDLTPKP